MIRFLLLACAWLAGCAATPSAVPPVSLAGKESFAFSGRLSVRQGETQHHLRIDWRHSPDDDEILLSTPFGQGVAEIVRNPGGARLLLADGRVFEAADWGELTERLFAVRLPLTASARWLLDDRAETGDWRVWVLQRLEDRPDGPPTLVEAEQGEINLRLRIDDWQEPRP